MAFPSPPPPHIQQEIFQFYNYKELNSASNLNALRSELFPRGAWQAILFWPCEILSRGYSPAFLETDLQNYDRIVDRIADAIICYATIEKNTLRLLYMFLHSNFFYFDSFGSATENCLLSSLQL